MTALSTIGKWSGNVRVVSFGLRMFILPLQSLEDIQSFMRRDSLSIWVTVEKNTARMVRSKDLQQA